MAVLAVEIFFDKMKIIKWKYNIKVVFALTMFPFTVQLYEGLFKKLKKRFFQYVNTKQLPD
jgi:hypothetical protein